MQLKNNNVVEIIGVVAIVASLIFVGLQFMLDRRIAIADQYAARAESVKEDRRVQLGSDSFLSLQAKNWEAGIRPEWWNDELERIYSGRGLTGDEIYSDILSYRMYIIHADNLHFQYSQGLLDQSFYEEFNETLKNDLRDPVRRAVYQSYAGRLRPIIDAMIIEIDNE